MTLEEKIVGSDIVSMIEIPEVIVRMRADGIVHVTFRKGIVLDLELQSKLLAINIRITEGKKSYFIYDAEDSVTITKEARDNATKIEHLAPIKASAVVANNLAYRLVANFYMKFNKPKTPYKVFDNLENGIAWLKTSPDNK
jgi:hypothetical protein